MPITVFLTTLLNIFATPNPCGAEITAPQDPPLIDLCSEDVYLDAAGRPLVDANGTTLSRYCVWTDEDAPVWADEVCCELGPDSASCTPTDALGECSSTQVKRWCDYAEVDREQVTCLQPLPSACDMIECKELSVGTQPQQASAALCCWAGICYELEFEEACGGSLSFCDSPFTEGDGSVGCADWD